MKNCLRVFASLLLTSLVLTGCGGGGVPVEVKVVNGDKPYSEATDGKVSLAFSSVDPKGPTFAGTQGSDGAFKLKSSTSDGVTPGKYNVKVTSYPAMGSGDAAPSSPPMPTSKSLPDPIEVTASTKTVTVDLSKLK